MKRVENHSLKICAHLLSEKNGVKRSQRKVIERRRESERLLTGDGERMREQGSGKRKKGEENYMGHRREIMESCKPALKLQLLPFLAVGP